MKIKSIFFIYLFLLIAILSCDKKEDNTFDKKSKEVPENPIGIVNEDNKAKIKNDCYKKFLTEREKVIENLKSASKIEANKIFIEYSKINKVILSEINEYEQKTLDRFYDEDENSKNDKIKLSSKLKNHQLRYEEMGEGYVNITTIPSFYNDMFKNYVTDDYKEYIRLISEENKVTYSADAGLVITFKELGDRIISWENFISKYPESKLVEEVKSFLKNYRLDYILGMDNTPTFERDFENQTETNKKILYINKENLEEFNRFLKEYPKSPTSMIIKLFIGNYKDKQEDELFDLIRNEVNKI